VDYLNQKHDFSVGYPQFVETVELVLNNPPPPLNHVWESFTRVQKVAAAGLAQALTDDAEYATPEKILEALPAELHPVAADAVGFRSALDDLRHEDWVEKNPPEGYRFRIDLFRLWLRREHSVWQVADELQRGAAL
jgi:hypothetical protein